jgi:neutral ceramidase
MKILRNKFFLLTAIVILMCLSIAVLVLAPVDNSPYPQSTGLESVNRIDLTGPSDTGIIQAGWAKASLLPPFKTPLAGYGGRKGKLFRKVSQSIYTRAIVFSGGGKKIAVISMDLLLVPPSVFRLLKTRLPGTGWRIDQIYFAAAHTHSSLGGWGKGIGEELFAGPYNPKVVELICNSVVQALTNAQSDLQPVTIGYGQYQAAGLITNRLRVSAGKTDPWFRVIELKNNSGKKAVLCSFSAHATCLSAANMDVSGDYPGILTENLEKSGKYDFAVFMAGMTGSQGPVKDMNLTGSSLSGIIISNQNKIAFHEITKLNLSVLPLKLREPQLRINDQIRIRPWLFHLLLGDYPADIRMLVLNDIVMFGVPCDFSGELMPEFGSADQDRFIITGFNGGYIGYVTPDPYFHFKTYETMLMNWYGPGSASYLVRVMKQMAFEN